MPISPDRRINKYIAKVDPETIKAHFQALKPSMVEQVSNLFPSLYQMEVATKTVLDSLGTPMGNYPMYLSFARQVWRLINKIRLGGTALDREISILLSTWGERGLDSSTLRQILRDVFGYLPPAGP